MPGIWIDHCAGSIRYALEIIALQDVPLLGQVLLKLGRFCSLATMSERPAHVFLPMDWLVLLVELKVSGRLLGASCLSVGLRAEVIVALCPLA